MDASPLQPAESPPVPNASAPADTRGDGPGPGPGLGPDPTHDGSSSYRHRNSFPLPADGSLGPSASNGDDSQYGGVPRVSKKRKKAPSPSGIADEAPSPPGIADDLSPALVEDYLNSDLKAHVCSFLESTEVFAMNDIDLTLATFADGNDRFELHMIESEVMVCENWKDILDAKRDRENRIRKDTATKVVSKQTRPVHADSFVFSSSSNHFYCFRYFSRLTISMRQQSASSAP